MPDRVAAAGTGVTVVFEGDVAIADSDFSIPEAATTAVIGPNGSGKSTLLNLLTGLTQPAAGTVKVLGAAPGKVRQRVAYVLQTNKVNEVMPITVREVVSMGRYAELGLFGRFRSLDHGIVDEALDRLEIANLGSRHITELSGGQRQRVFVAQGLAQGADLLLLDEPVTGLDIGSRDLIIAAIDAEREAGRTIVFTTHDLADAGRADHVLLMASKVYAEGSPDEVLDPDLLSVAYGVGILHLEDGSLALDDGHHAAARHVHFERRL